MSLCMCLCEYQLVMGHNTADALNRNDIKLKQKPIDCLKVSNKAGVEYYSANWHEWRRLYPFKSNNIILLFNTVICNKMYQIKKFKSVKISSDKKGKKCNRAFDYIIRVDYFCIITSSRVDLSEWIAPLP